MLDLSSQKTIAWLRLAREDSARIADIDTPGFCKSAAAQAVGRGTSAGPSD